MRRFPRLPIVLVALLLVCSAMSTARQRRPSVDDFLSPAYPYELVAARTADRIAWLSFESGKRNVYTAAAPAFRPVRLTQETRDDGWDLTDLRISNDGSLVVFVRGHAPNRDGWIANPTSNPEGAQRTIWAARTAGGA